MPKKLSDAAVAALHGADGPHVGVPTTAHSKGWLLRLPVQLDRKVYVEVDAALQEIGGKWNRKLKAHVFAEDPRDKIAAMSEAGERPDVGKDFGFFETPDALADRMVELLGATLGDRVLEPSAGEGALVKALIRSGARIGSLDLIEIRSECLLILDRILENDADFDYNPTIGDFLEHEFLSDEEGVIPYDRIIMNPPFSVPGTPMADVVHVTRALELLAPGGRLVACMSPAWLGGSSQHAQAFRLRLGLPPGCTPLGDGSMVQVNAPGTGLLSWRWHANPPGSFRESGTDVSSGLLVAWLS